jgi:pimeloyl-ACP methyl ester carboxylesterase
MMVGHDQGSLLAAYGALIRPDMFPRLSLIGGGFNGTPSFPFNTANGAPAERSAFTNAELDAEYAKLGPPCRGYQDYWASPEADRDMKQVPQGMTNFFRAFYYMKSADFPGNQNLKPLHEVRTAKEAAQQNAQMPEYYVMRRGVGMPATVAAAMPCLDCRKCAGARDRTLSLGRKLRRDSLRRVASINQPFRRDHQPRNDRVRSRAPRRSAGQD